MTSKRKPILRIIHHFACSGGTLISKCIAAQPNVFLLSELNPYSKLHINKDQPNFTPTDIITQAHYARVPHLKKLSEEIFIQNIISTERHIRQLGGHLIIRAHTHSDFCVGKGIIEKETTNKLLKAHFEIKNLITIRDPIDAYLSLKENNWVHFHPKSFDEYCQRMLAFTNEFKHDHTVKYEDFIENPIDTMREICTSLNLKENLEFEEIIDIFQISGDSGRAGSKIYKREQKIIDELYYKEIESSDNYKKIMEMHKYSPREIK